MISCPTVEKRVIRSHYNLATPFYRLLWGRHIHHGLWEGSESPAEAQLKLTQTLVREAGIRGGERVLDVGCGMGGSSIYLAKTLGCDVTGVTLSPVQRGWAAMAARLNGVGRKTRFLATDAETVQLASLRQAGLLSPSGRMAASRRAGGHLRVAGGRWAAERRRRAPGL
jgi:tocopherol O-methyltransferase